jgi:hypothetical protein
MNDFDPITVGMRLAHKIKFEIVYAHDAVSEFLLDQGLYRGAIEPAYVIRPINQWIGRNLRGPSAPRGISIRTSQASGMSSKAAIFADPSGGEDIRPSSAAVTINGDSPTSAASVFKVRRFAFTARSILCCSSRLSVARSTIFISAHDSLRSRRGASPYEIK